MRLFPTRRAKIITTVLVVLALLPVGLVYGLFRYINDTGVHPDDPALGLPAPTVAMSIVSAGSEKRAALDAHVSQTGILQAVQPGYDKLPSWIYFRILSREYFTQIF